MSDRNMMAVSHWCAPRALCSLATPALAAAGAVLLVMAAATPAAAVITRWTGQVSNDWTDPGNWDNGVPFAGDNANLITTTPNPTVLGASGKVDTQFNFLGVGTVGGTGHLTIQSGSTIGLSGAVNVGDLGNGVGTIEITNGQLNTTSTVLIGPGGQTTTGTVTVTGVNSRLTAKQLDIGNAGHGTLNIMDNATVTAQQFVQLGSPVLSGLGTLNVTTGGTLETPQLGTALGQLSGTKQVTFDRGTLRALGNNATFIAGFSGTEFKIAAGGMTIDNAGFAIGTDNPLTGPGGLTSTGSGTLTLSGANTFAGGLTVDAGTVIAGIATTAFGSGTLTVASGATANLAGFSQTVGGLAGAGSVVLGGGTLTLDQNIDTTFSGVISNGGALVMNGTGTLVLSGNNTFFGTVFLNAGTISVSSDANLGNGGLNFNGGTLQVTGTAFTSTARTISWGANGGGFDIADAANTFTVSQALAGGPLKVNPLGGQGTLKLTNNDTFTTTDVFSGGLLVDAAGSITSPITAHAAGTLGGTGAINGDVNNFGTLAPALGLAMGAGTPGAQMTINGTYNGNSGSSLAINALLGDNTNSVTDQLVVNNGAMTGSTAINVNVDPTSPGGITTGNGIPIVVAGGTTTTDPKAFTLGSAVTGGAKAYVLLQGQSGTPQELNSWYLCSTTDCVNAGGQGGPGGPFLPPLGGPPLPPGQPLLHGGTPMQSLYGTMARQLGLMTLGTFHERNGDQRLADTGGRERGWARVFGEHTEQSHAGTVRPSFDGDFVGLQGGFDLWQFASLPGHHDNVGMFAAYTEGRAQVSGLVFAIPGLFAGNTDFNATSLGAYWSHIAPGAGWYTDAVLMGTLYDGDGRTRHATDVGVEGSGVIASFEGGFTLARFMGLKLEPQAQLVYQYVNLDEAHHNNSDVDHHTPDALHGRIGLRLAADQLPWLLRPYLKANIWQDFVGADRTTWGGADELVIRHRATVLELGGGFTAQIAPNVALWASADWSTDIGGDEQERESVSGNAGLRIVW